MLSFFLTYKNSRIRYCQFGTGNKPAFCIHGYGETATSFLFLEKYTSEFNFFSIDLPYHGETEWNDGLNFSKMDLKNIFLAIIEQHNIQPKDKIYLIGFSLGGRIALSLFQLLPEKTERIILMAPDGLKVNFWYWLSTQTLIGNKVFAYTMKKPEWFFGFIKLLNRLNLVNTSIFKFVHYYIDNSRVRQDLYNRWTTLRKLSPDIFKIKSLIKIYQTKVKLIYGKYDRIILSVRGEKFCSGIDGFCSVLIIHSGHQVLSEKHVHEILPAFIQ